MKHLAIRLKQVREGLQLTQREMAIACGIGRTTYIRYEHGERLDFLDFLNCLAALGVDLHHLITGDKYDKNKADTATVGRRLMQERKRLHFTQHKFATLIGISRNTLVRWETDVASPTINDLAKWSIHGVDISYVVIGKRSNP